MGGLQQDAAAARGAVRELQRAVESLGRHYRDNVDARRLEVDAQRLAEDLDLLVAPEATAAAPPVLEVIEDREYPPEFWADAESEGIGPR